MITVFTPTYNRAYCLHQLYNSLLNQTDQNFVWLLIDDGSTDNTKELVQSWITENKIEINYIFKENGGMHTGHNLAYDMISTELNICIDSDDFMPNDAIEKIIKTWKEKGNPELAGIIGLDSFTSGAIVGASFPTTLEYSKLNDLYTHHKISGDKKLVLRTAVVNEFPRYPVYKNERLVPLGTLYLMIDQKYNFICLNEVLCIIEYLEDGSSRNILKQYKKSPKGFGYSRIVKIKHSQSLLEKFKNSIHLVSSSLFARDINLLFKSPNPILAILAIPFGILLSIFIEIKTRSLQ